MDRWNGMYLELMVRTMARLTMKTMSMIRIPSNIVASTGKSKVQLIVEAKAHKDVLDLWNIINIAITISHHHYHHYHHHQQERRICAF